jgi:hypothetical protein
MNYHITFTDVNGITQKYPGHYITLRKARNEVKWMCTRECFRNITIWEGCPGGIRIETKKDKK